eukprot:scaffold13321_cov37-Phaeocystis_antarctica.AAC.1
MIAPVRIAHPAEARAVASWTRSGRGSVEWKCSGMGHARRGAADRTSPSRGPVDCGIAFS